GAAPEEVVVAGQQQAVVGVLGVVVPAEAEAVPGVQPARLGPLAGGGPDHLNARSEDRAAHVVFVDREAPPETPLPARFRRGEFTRINGAAHPGLAIFPGAPWWGFPVGRDAADWLTGK